MLTELEKALSGFFLDKMPPLPDNLKSGTVKYLPWVLIILGIIGLLSMISILGLFSAASVLAIGATGMAMMHSLSVYDLVLMYILAPLQSLLVVLAGYWMLNRQLAGWRLALICTLLGFIIHLLHFSVIGLAVDFLFAYLLFQTRENYV